MRLSEELYQQYLEELQELETFKLSHADGYFGILKEVMDDPHTKHIIETLAFFVARSHLHGEKTVLNLYRRLFRQYFPYLWSPMPSMGLLQFDPTKNLMEKITCKKGTEINLQTRDGQSVYFQTTESVKVLPIQQGKFLFEVKKNGNARFFLQFKSMVHQKEEIGQFRLFINSLNSFRSSWSLSIALRQHLNSVRISYNTPSFEDSNGIPCSFSFTSANFDHLLTHPMEQLRASMNFPEQDLFLDLEIPRHDEKWQTFTLFFDLGNDWPEFFPLSDETFHPFVVPIINLQKKGAELIRCDGTQDFYPILHPTPEKKFSIHSVQGVYRLINHKPVPLTPSFIHNDGESYEIEPIFKENKTPEYKLQLDLPDALRSTQLIVVEAMWYQPWFDKLEHDVKALFLNQSVNELHIRTVGALASPEDRTVTYDFKLLTRLLSLKNQTKLELNDILFLLNILKLNSKSEFKEIPRTIKDLKVNLRFSSLSTGVTQEYSFMLEKLDDRNQDLVLLYFRNVKKFLDLWISNIDVEVIINAPNFKEPITIKEGSSHETSTLVRNLYLLQ